MSTNELFLIALAVIFAAPWLIWRALGQRSFAPLVVVQIICGILLGPGVFGAVWPEGQQALFRPEVISALNAVALWAIVLFVWLAGLELDFAEARANWREAGTVALLALLVPLVLGAAAAWLLIQMPGWQGDKGAAWQVVVGFGMASAVTALPILVLFLDQLGVLRDRLGQRILSFASLDDIAIWGVLAVILLDGERILRQFLFIAVFAAAALLIRRLIPAIPERDRWHVALIWLALVAFAADWSGLHFMVGAFLAGVVLDRHWLGEATVERLRGTILLVLMPIFFMSTGLRTSWEGGGWQVFGAAALLLVASVGGKLAGVALAGRILGWKKGEAALVGWLLQTKALIMIIFAAVLLDKAIISSDAFTALLLMALGSTMLTMPVVTRLLARQGTN